MKCGKEERGTFLVFFWYYYDCSWEEFFFSGAGSGFFIPHLLTQLASNINMLFHGPSLWQFFILSHSVKSPRKTCSCCSSHRIFDSPSTSCYSFTFYLYTSTFRSFKPLSYKPPPTPTSCRHAPSFDTKVYKNSKTQDSHSAKTNNAPHNRHRPEAPARSVLVRILRACLGFDLNLLHYGSYPETEKKMLRGMLRGA